MSQAVCAYSPGPAAYPPVRYSAEDQAALAKIRTIKSAAPYGRNAAGGAINELTYRLLVAKRKEALRSVDFRWPFWAGLGLGSAAVFVLIAKR